eukprot:gene10493-12411_t
MLFARPAIAANLHSLHRIHVPLHNRAAKLLVHKLHACPNLATFVVDGAKVYGLFDIVTTHALTRSPNRAMPAMRTFVACYTKETTWQEPYILINATALTTLYLHKARLEGEWAKGAELPGSLRVTHLHDGRADVSFYIALARAPALANCCLNRCLDYLGPKEIFDEVLPAWKLAARATLRSVMVVLHISYLRNANLRYHVGLRTNFWIPKFTT